MVGAGPNQPGITGHLHFGMSFPQVSDVVEFIH